MPLRNPNFSPPGRTTPDPNFWWNQPSWQGGVQQAAGYQFGGEVDDQSMDPALPPALGSTGGGLPPAMPQTGYAPDAPMDPQDPALVGQPPQEEQQPKEQQPKQSKGGRKGGGRKGGGRRGGGRRRKTGYAKGGEVQGYAYGGDVDEYGNTDSRDSFGGAYYNDELERKQRDPIRTEIEREARTGQTEDESIPQNARATEGQQDLSEQLGSSFIGKEQTGFQPQQNDSYDPMGMVREVLNHTRNQFGLGGEQAGYDPENAPPYQVAGGWQPPPSARGAATQPQEAAAEAEPRVGLSKLPGPATGRGGTPIDSSQLPVQPPNEMYFDFPGRLQEPQQPVIEPAGGQRAVTGIGLPPEPAGGKTAGGDFIRRAGAALGFGEREAAAPVTARTGYGAQTEAPQPQQLGDPSLRASPAQGPDLEGYMRGANADPPNVLAQKLQAIATNTPGASEAEIVQQAVSNPNIPVEERAGTLAGMRQSYDHQVAMALGAFENGNTAAAIHLAEKAHDRVPDGQTLKFTPTTDGQGVLATVEATQGGGPQQIPLTMQQFRDYLVGPATSFDHVVENGVAKNLQIASGRGAEDTDFSAVRRGGAASPQAASARPAAAMASAPEYGPATSADGRPLHPMSVLPGMTVPTPRFPMSVPTTGSSAVEPTYVPQSSGAASQGQGQPQAQPLPAGYRPPGAIPPPAGWPAAQQAPAAQQQAPSGAIVGGSSVPSYGQRQQAAEPQQQPQQQPQQGPDRVQALQQAPQRQRQPGEYVPPDIRPGQRYNIEDVATPEARAYAAANGGRAPPGYPEERGAYPRELQRGWTPPSSDPAPRKLEDLGGPLPGLLPGDQLIKSSSPGGGIRSGPDAAPNDLGWLSNRTSGAQSTAVSKPAQPLTPEQIAQAGVRAENMDKRTKLIEDYRRLEEEAKPRGAAPGLAEKRRDPSTETKWATSQGSKDASSTGAKGGGSSSHEQHSSQTPHTTLLPGAPGQYIPDPAAVQGEKLRHEAAVQALRDYGPAPWDRPGWHMDQNRPLPDSVFQRGPISGTAPVGNAAQQNSADTHMLNAYNHQRTAMLKYMSDTGITDVAKVPEVYRVNPRLEAMAQDYYNRRAPQQGQQQQQPQQGGGYGSPGWPPGPPEPGRRWGKDARGNFVQY